MKKYLVVIISICSQLLFAKNNVPDAVAKIFAEKFPGAVEVKWEKEKKEFEASFMLNGIKISANFSTGGKWLETETAISEKELPEVVIKAFKGKFPNNEITAAAKIESAEGISYEIEYKSGKKTKEVEFDVHGNIKK